MKKLLLGALLSACLTQYGQAQTKDMPWQVGLGVGISEYSGDLGNGFFKFDLTAHNVANNGGGKTQNTPGIGYLTVSRYLSKQFDVAARGYLGEWGYFDKVNVVGNTNIGNFYRQTLGFEVTPRWKFLEKDDAMFTPYITLGLGVRRINMPTDRLEDFGIAGMDKGGLYEFTVPAGLGVNVRLTEKFGLNLQSNYMWTNNDKSENTSALEQLTYDQAWFHTIGVTMNLGKVIDTDADGVGDKRDKCPNTPAGDLVNPTTGCSIDTDKDGIADNKDACPLVAGVAAFKGCPDADNDGVQDSEDKCPTAAGVYRFNGCPDTDNDGIQDSEDACPTVAGVAKVNGCPDSDNDGIEDKLDNCPQKAGIAKFNGCPDTDGDGIEDKLDNCPKVFGVAANNGCPEVKAAVKQLFEKALQGVQFETGKSVLKPNSFAILNNVVKVMIENPTYKLYILGHTDNVGDAAKNLKLSQERAAAVEKFLESKGVNTLRVRSEGFGDTKPAYDNATTEGKTKNRRVEFKVEFEE
ncbi:MAG: thrombospondin type 3 repeat-containing protein [Candidatus Methylacidiphilales bacterium]